jgi:hypothetical protein
MWPGQQPSGDEQNPPNSQSNPYQQPNPYARQAGYPGQPVPPAQPAQPNPYQQPSGQPPWAAPTVPAGVQPPPAGGGGNRTRTVAIGAAIAVVLACGVTTAVVLGSDKDDPAKPDPTASASTTTDPNPRSPANAHKPLIPGWKAVLNPTRGVAFDVPPQWAIKPVTWSSYVADRADPDEKPLIGFTAPAMLKEKWCQSDADKDGTLDDSALGMAGSRGEAGAKSTTQAAVNSVGVWVYGAYTQPNKDNIHTTRAESFTTKSGLKGTVATATSSGVTTEKTGKCDTDGKATTFAFLDTKGDLVSWSFVGAAGVPDEIPDATVQKILSTVRVFTPPKPSS